MAASRLAPRPARLGSACPPKPSAFWFEEAVGQSQHALPGLDRIERGERSLHAGQAATEGDHGMVNTPTRYGSDVDSTPIAWCRFLGQRVILGGVRSEGPAGAVAIILEGGQDDLSPRQTLRQQLGPHRRFDARAIQLDDDARIDLQSSVDPCF